MSEGPAKIFSTRENVVGIIANPASGRDIRRLVAQGGVFTIAEKCSIIIRLIRALGVTGVGVILMIPDRGGIAERVRRALATRSPDDQGPKVVFLDMPVEDGPADTVRGAAQMVAAGARAIVVLGGDGTQRLVAGACGEVPIMPLSTGTNNVFPESREATIAGLATGLVAAGKIPAAEATVRNKILRLEMDGVPNDLAVVDISVAAQPLGGIEGAMAPGSPGPDLCHLCRTRCDWTIIRGWPHPACLPACTSWSAHRSGATRSGESHIDVPHCTRVDLACRH